MSTPDLGAIRSIEYLREFITYAPGTTLRPQREKAEMHLAALCDRVAELETALRPFMFARIEYPALADDEILELRRFNVEPRDQRVLYPSIRMKHVRAARVALADPPTEGE